MPWTLSGRPTTRILTIPTPRPGRCSSAAPVPRLDVLSIPLLDRRHREHGLVDLSRQSLDMHRGFAGRWA